MLELESRWLAYGLMVLPIASVHVWFGSFAERFSRSEPRWIGVISGVALGYVVLYMLPKLSAITMAVVQADPELPYLLQNRAFLILLVGIVTYVFIDRLNQSGANRARVASTTLEYGVHCTYSLLVGFVAVEMPAHTLLAHGLAASILLMHVMGMSDLLRHHRPVGYRRVRWLFMILVLLGGMLGLVTEVPRVLVDSAVALTGGVIIVNVLAQELPVGRRDKFGWFLLGVAAFVVITVVIGTQRAVA
jgi:hypothetical protein